jgi:hypothetical protein
MAFIFTDDCGISVPLAMRNALIPLVLSLALGDAVAKSGGHDHAQPPMIDGEDSSRSNLWTGEGVGIGGVLFPSANFTTAFGASTADDPASLAVGHHDPDRDGWTIQNVEFSIEARVGEHVRAFALYAAKIDLDDHWDDHFEEYYLAIEELPGNLRLRAGRFYTVFGFQNNRHPHEFDWADQYLMNGRFIGDDALTVYGGEVVASIAVVVARGMDRPIYVFSRRCSRRRGT